MSTDMSQVGDTLFPSFYVFFLSFHLPRFSFYVKILAGLIDLSVPTPWSYSLRHAALNCSTGYTAGSVPFNKGFSVYSFYGKYIFSSMGEEFSTSVWDHC